MTRLQLPAVLGVSRILVAMYEIAEDLGAAITDVDPHRLVVVEQHPDYPGSLLFQTVYEPLFPRYSEWVSRYLCLNELFLLCDFVSVLEKDGWVVAFGPSSRPVLEAISRWEQPLQVKGLTVPNNGSLYPYQTFTLNRALERAEGHTAADRLTYVGWATGTGKSLFAAAGAQEMFNRGQADICLAFTLGPLRTNLTRFLRSTTELEVVMPDGSPAKRRKAYAENHSVYVLNYEKARVDYEALTELTEGRRVLFICDEAHKLLTDGSPNTFRKCFDKLVKSCSATVWPMSASVVSSNPLRYRDVFNLTGDPANPLGTKSNFVDRYASEVRTFNMPTRYGSFPVTFYEWDTASLHEVRHRVSDRAQSVRKTDPSIRDLFKGLQTVVVPIQMSQQDRRLYNHIIDLARAVKGAGGNLMPYYRLLRYVCNNPASLRWTADPTGKMLWETYPALVTSSHSAKLDTFLDLVESIQSSGDKTLVFTQWVSMSLDLIASALTSRQINFVVHHGSQTAAENQEAQEKFKTDPDVTVFLSSDAGAHGLNMIEARYVIHYEAPYSYDVMMQRSNRIDRADSYLDGLTSYVFVTDDSVEERVWGICNERRELASATLGTTEVLSYSSRSESENLEYLIFGRKSKIEPPPLEGDRDGETFDPFLDSSRLNEQMRRVFAVMCDSQWRSLKEIASMTGDPEASISARLRDFRKPKFGQLILNRRRRTVGTFEYQIMPSAERLSSPAG